MKKRYWKVILCLLLLLMLPVSTKATETESRTKEKTMGNTSEEIDVLLSQMTPHEKICQMFFVTPESITGEKVVTTANDEMKEALIKYPVGGIIYSKGNLINAKQTKEMLKNTQDFSKIDLFLAVDEEGGTVSRLMKTLGTTYVGSMYSYRNKGGEVAYQNAFTIATDMSSFGFNLDFAPVADVWSNPKNTVIGKRAYSDSYEQAAFLIPFAVKGFEDGGVMCTLKHFPGHGDTMEDSHDKSAYVYKTKEQLMKQEMLPFEAGIEAGADFVMVGHLIVKDIDMVPATFSEKMIQGMLRDELNFKGIVITDAMRMNAVTDHYTSGEMAVMAIKAGNDMILEVPDVAEAVNAVENAVINGEISMDRIDESVRRILTLKMKKGLSTEEF